MSDTLFARSRDGTSIAYRKLGEGPPLIVVHGGLNSGADWRPVAKLLASRFTCFLFDRRGRGESGDHPDYALAREVEDLSAVLDVAGPEAAVLAHSFGAVVALETALVRPIARLVVYEPPLHAVGDAGARDMLVRYQALLGAGDPEGAVGLFLVEGTGMPAQALPFLQATAAWTRMVTAAPTLVRESGFQDLDLAGRYAGLSLPLTVLLGGASNPRVKAAMEDLATEVRGARLVVLEGQGHAAHRMAPDVVAAAI